MSGFSFGAKLPGCVMLDKLVQFINSKLAQLHDRGLPAVCRRQHVSRFFPAVDIHHDPRLVYVVATTEVGMRQEVRAGFQKYFDGAGARNDFRFVWNLNQKLGHGRSFPSRV